MLRLRTQFADAKAIMEQKLRRGIRVSSHYSGKGTGESCASQIERAIRDDVVAEGSAIALDLRCLPQQQFQPVFSVDCSETARKALLATGCKHVFGKIEDRMRPDLQRQLKMMEPADTVSCADKEQQHSDIKELLFQAHPPSHTADLQAWCYRRQKNCNIWDGFFDDIMDIDEDEEPQPEPYHINVSGFACTDFSRRRATALPRFAGKTAPTFWKWLREIQLCRPHYVFWECSPFFPEEVIANEMDGEYLQITIITGPTLMGWPVTRLRKFGCLIRRDILFLGSDKEFHSMFQRQCSVNGDIFFTAAPDEYIVDQMISKAKSRGYYPQKTGDSKPQDFPPDVMITPAMKMRMTNYGKKRSHPGQAMLVDLDQNENFGSCHECIPSIPTHSSIYSFVKGRLLLGKELLFCMGTLASWQSRLTWAVIHSCENLFLPELPASLLADVNFSDTECQFLAGNCFAMNVMGSWMMYVLARTIPMPMASATSHNCSFMLRGDNGQRTRSFEDLSDGDSDGGHGDESSGV
ncbi:unnamed protein product [Symbiodinium necroappetens]|uniref:Uncharacterized protein n=1 Tax=Symbiodinium necroappetens TaxID=1628268 RepID=A0A812Z1W2_9DINO|nr:unnamed protein product [Symbiodinium necroappetens]